MTMPDELARLDAEYNRLVDAFESGHISQDDAITTLGAMTASDASGAVWAINGDGDFVRSPYPGAPASVAEPGQWVGNVPAPAMPAMPSMPSMPSATGFPAPGRPHVSTPTGPMSPAIPAGPSSMPSMPASGHGAWADEDALDGPPQQLSAATDLPSAATPVPSLSYAPGAASSKVGRPLASARRGQRSPMVDSLIARVKDNKVFVGIVIIALVVAAFLATRHSPAKNQTQIPSGIPGTSAPTASGQQAMPTGGPSSPGQSSPTAAAVAPTTALARQIISALTSGKENIVSSAMATAPDANTLAKGAALWAGTAQLKFGINPGPAAMQGAGAVQDWTITDGTRTVATVKVTWVQVSVGWRLAALPLY